MLSTLSFFPFNIPTQYEEGREVAVRGPLSAMIKDDKIKKRQGIGKYSDDQSILFYQSIK